VNKTGNARCAKTYRNEKWHVNTKYSVVSDFTHDGNVLTGSEAGRPVLYDLQSRQVLQTLRGHTDVVLAVSAHDKLPLLCTGGMTSDRKVYFWMRRDGVDEVEEEEGEEEKERRDGIPGENVESRGAVEEEAAPEAVMAINSSDDEATDSPNAKKLKS
jgi:WD40 repeat protein